MSIVNSKNLSKSYQQVGCNFAVVASSDSVKKEKKVIKV